MKNLKYIDCNELDVLKEIVNSKQLKTRGKLNNIIKRIEVEYEQYLNHFDDIHNIGESNFDTNESEILQGCYSSNTKAKSQLIKNIILAQTKHFQNVCGYCLINTRNTIDHYIPETSFPVYSVLVKNLFPCCSICNQKKLEYWRENNNRAIIHFYNDMNLDVQFLFGSIIYNQKKTPIFSFELRNENNITDNNFSIIQKHFERLDLINRYVENVNLVISDIKDDVEINKEEFGELITKEKIQSILLRKSQKLVEYFGINYWKAIIIELLAKSDDFYNPSC